MKWRKCRLMWNIENIVITQGRNNKCVGPVQFKAVSQAVGPRPQLVTHDRGGVQMENFPVWPLTPLDISGDLGGSTPKFCICIIIRSISRFSVFATWGGPLQCGGPCLVEHVEHAIIRPVTTSHLQAQVPIQSRSIQRPPWMFWYYYRPMGLGHFFHSQWAQFLASDLHSGPCRD